MCSSLKSISEASHLNLLLFYVLNLFLLGIQPPFTKALHLRWLTTEKFQNYETVKGGCTPSKYKFKTQRNNKLRWLASDINFKLLSTGCPIAHGLINRRCELLLVKSLRYVSRRSLLETDHN